MERTIAHGVRTVNYYEIGQNYYSGEFAGAAVKGPNLCRAHFVKQPEVGVLRQPFGLDELCLAEAHLSLAVAQVDVRQPILAEDVAQGLRLALAGAYVEHELAQPVALHVR